LRAQWRCVCGRLVTPNSEKKKAFAALNKAYENREYRITLLKVDPRFDSLLGNVADPLG
jgi:hypothetical protein